MPPPKPDSLKKVEGIGPKIEKLINDMGVWTFRQLADTPVEKLQKMLEDAGPAYRISDPTTWPKQAGMAADGKWDELKEYQDRLDGGKDVE
jgi:predicted flap endonuclease-1-like 5' DNA nuclease